MARKPTVSIVGAGRVGASIGVALTAAGYDITAAWSHSRAGRERVHQLLDCPVLDPADAAGAGDLVFLSVPDDAIGDMVTEIVPGLRAGKTVVHTSGATGVTVLAPAREAGAHVGSVHPLQTFPDIERGAEALKGAAVAVTADAPDRPRLVRIARAWGGRPFILADEHKQLYHAAAVFASNYVVSSVWAATRLLEGVGIRNGGQILAPLVRATVENVLTQGGRKSITGPVARGDAKVVRRHVKALREADPTDTAFVDAYRAFAKMTAALTGGDTAPIDKATA